MIVVMMITAKEKIIKMMMNEILKLSDASSFILSDQSLSTSYSRPSPGQVTLPSIPAAIALARRSVTCPPINPSPASNFY